MTAFVVRLGGGVMAWMRVEWWVAVAGQGQRDPMVGDGTFSNAIIPRNAPRCQRVASRRLRPACAPPRMSRCRVRWSRHTSGMPPAPWREIR